MTEGSNEGRTEEREKANFESAPIQAHSVRKEGRMDGWMDGWKGGGGEGTKEGRRSTSRH